MQKIFKESKEIKKGLNAYLDLLITENSISEIEKMQVWEIMNDIKVQKAEFKANIKNP